MGEKVSEPGVPLMAWYDVEKMNREWRRPVGDKDKSPDGKRDDGQANQVQA